MPKTPMDRIEDERKRRGEKKRPFAMATLGVSSAVYNNWLSRGLSKAQADTIISKINPGAEFKWTLDYLWHGKKDGIKSDADSEYKDAALVGIEIIAGELPPPARIELLKYARYLQYLDKLRIPPPISPKTRKTKHETVGS